jgi:hypothetical protein
MPDWQEVADYAFGSIGSTAHKPGQSAKGRPASVRFVIAMAGHLGAAMGLAELNRGFHLSSSL